VRWRTEKAGDLVDDEANDRQPFTDTPRECGAAIGGAPPPTLTEGTDAMLYTIAFVLLILWALGLVTSYTMGGFIHLLLVIAIVMVLLRLISGRAVA
jgi:Family of unknown function (DUF5670)